MPDEERSEDEPTLAQPPAAPEPGEAAEAPPEEDPTEPVPVRWKGSAPVPESTDKRRRKGVLREPTREMPTVDGGAAAGPGDDDEPWPPPPPPRPANAPVTAPYPPPPPAASRRPPKPPAVRRPPQFQARPPYPPPYRKRRRWPWVMAVLLAVTALCCGCCWNWIRPFVEEYPATAALPPQAAGLVKVDDAAARRSVTELELKVRSDHWLADQTFAAVYADPDDRRQRVTIYGATMFVLDPGQELDGTFAELTGDYDLTDAQSVPPGAPGGLIRCASGTSGGNDSVSVCAWTDHGSKAVGIFPGRPLSQGADLIRNLRAAIITRG